MENIRGTSANPTVPIPPRRELAKADLDAFSDEVIDYYSALRFTSPYSHHTGISRIKIQLPPVHKSDPISHRLPGE